jgi:uncharacterized protein
MIHPATRVTAIDDNVGFGLVATEFIPRGTITWFRDSLDCLISASTVRSMPSLYADTLSRYSYQRRDGEWVLLWDDARYMNHSCNPNCVITDFDFEIAIRDIAPGEQLTNDYAMMHLTDDEPFRCRCGEPLCRSKVEPSDALRLGPQWDAHTAAALEAAVVVAQPLADLVDPVQLRRARVHLSGWPGTRQRVLTGQLVTRDA